MKIRTLLLPLFAFAPLSAQAWELGVFAGNQSYHSLSNSMPGLTEYGLATQKTAVGARLGYSVVDFGSTRLQLTLGYQPTVTTTARIISQGTSVPGQSPTDSGPLDYTASHSSVGLMFGFKAMIAMSAGVEMRFEKQSLPTQSTSFARPWTRVNIGLVLPASTIKPFIGLELAAAMSTGSENRVKALAPMSQVGLFGGIRF